MTDVLKIALDRRAALHEELSKLDDFIRMAEGLIKDTDGSQKTASSTTSEMSSGTGNASENVVRPQIQRHDDEEKAEADSKRPQFLRRATSVGGT